MKLLPRNQAMQMIKRILNQVMQKLFEKGIDILVYLYIYICIPIIIFKYNCMLLCSDEEHVGVENLISIVHDLWSTEN